jgi:hypothetical protein
MLNNNDFFVLKIFVLLGFLHRFPYKCVVFPPHDILCLQSIKLLQKFKYQKILELALKFT